LKLLIFSSKLITFNLKLITFDEKLVIFEELNTVNERLYLINSLIRETGQELQIISKSGRVENRRVISSYENTPENSSESGVK